MNYDFVKTTCPFCGCGCQMLLEVMDGRLVSTLPFKGARMNEGKLCIKGWNAHQFVQSPDRLTAPLVRKNGKLQETSWEEALDTVVTRLSDIAKTHGRRQPGIFEFSPLQQRGKLPASERSAGRVSAPIMWTTVPGSDTLPPWQVLPRRSAVAP